MLLGLLVACLLATAILFFLVNLPVYVSIIFTIGIWTFALAAVVFILYFRHDCSYVGEHGAARFRREIDRDRLVVSQILLFENAAELRVNKKRVLLQFAYQHTEYSYVWTDAQKKKLFSVAGKHHSEQDTPKDTNSYWLALAAESAWCKYLWEKMTRMLGRNEPLVFSLKGSDRVEVCTNGLRPYLGREMIELSKDDMAGIEIREGTFIIRRHDAKESLLSSAGVYRFNYKDLGNAKLFLHALERLVGVQIQA